MTDSALGTSHTCWYDEATLETIEARLHQQPARLTGGRLLAIDGPAGSGKTTLAAEVCAHLSAGDQRVTTFHMDDVYEGWSGLNATLEPRVVQQLLRPLSEGSAACWQRYDWLADRFAEWVSLDPPDVLILEGCGSGARAYAAFTSLLVWVEAGQQTRVRRGIARDGAEFAAHWRAWMTSEAAYFNANDTRRRADLHVSTDSDVTESSS